MKKLTLLLLALFIITSCKKDEVRIDPSIAFSDVNISFYSELLVNIKYDVIVKGNPVVRESGTIVTVDSEVSYFNNKVLNDEKLLKNVNIKMSVEAELQFFVRPYVITQDDTIYGDIQSFMSGSYYKNGNGVTDASGNNYNTIILGNQEWLAENLKTSKYCNGDSITFSTNDTIFFERYDEAQSLYYEYDVNKYNTYGMMYNGYALLDERNVCPCGWRVPRESDYAILFKYLGNNKYVGGKMKTTGILEEGTGLWENPNGRANNLSGFSALPGGYQSYPNYFYGENSYANFPYLDIEDDQQPVKMFNIDYSHGKINFFGNNKNSGMYTRCVRNL